MQFNLDCVIIAKVPDQVNNRVNDLVFVLSRYQADHRTAYQVLKDDVKAKTPQNTNVALLLTANGQVICQAHGDVDWLMQTEVFRTFSGFGEMEQTGIGFIDRTRNMRVAFEDGRVTIRPLK